MSHENGPLFRVEDLLLWAFIGAVVWAIFGACITFGFVATDYKALLFLKFALNAGMIGAVLGAFASVSFMGIFGLLKDFSAAYSAHMALMCFLALVVGVSCAYGVTSWLDDQPTLVLRPFWTRVFIGSFSSVAAMVTSLRMIGAVGKRM